LQQLCIVHLRRFGLLTSQNDVVWRLCIYKKRRSGLSRVCPGRPGSGSTLRVDRVSPGQLSNGFLLRPGPVSGPGQPAGPVRVSKHWLQALPLQNRSQTFFFPLLIFLSFIHSLPISLKINSNFTTTHTHAESNYRKKWRWRGQALAPHTPSDSMQLQHTLDLMDLTIPPVPSLLNSKTTPLCSSTLSTNRFPLQFSISIPRSNAFLSNWIEFTILFSLIRGCIVLAPILISFSIIFINC
jgi:hypothetical protein